jgi:predicted metal-dependent enzyme (double-stranded beta helix superfamily)
MYTIDDLVGELREATRTAELSAVQEAVRHAVAEQPLVADVGRMQILHEEPGLLVLHTPVACGIASPPHDHRTWAVIGVYDGQEDNTFYRLVPGTRAIEEVGGRSLREREVLTLGPDAIHKISNPRREALVALHVYGLNILKIDRSAWDLATMRERPFVVKLDGLRVVSDR